MSRSHSAHLGLSAVACGGSGPLKLLLAGAVGAVTDRTPAGRDTGATGADIGPTSDVTGAATGTEIFGYKKIR